MAAVFLNIYVHYQKQAFILPNIFVDAKKEKKWFKR